MSSADRWTSSVNALMITSIKWMLFVLQVTTGKVSLVYKTSVDLLSSAVALSFPFFSDSEPGTLIVSSPINSLNSFTSFISQAKYSMPVYYQDPFGILGYVHPDHAGYLNVGSGGDSAVSPVVVISEHRIWFNALRNAWMNQLKLLTLRLKSACAFVSWVAPLCVFVLVGVRRDNAPLSCLLIGAHVARKE